MNDLHVFISYSHNDIGVTEALAQSLESVGLKCWYAPRDIEPGAEWANSIVNAIQRAPYFVLVFSESSNQSDQVYNEVDMACKTSEMKHKVINLRISNVEVSARMSYYLNSKQWVDATEDPGRAYTTLAKQIRTDLGMGGVDPSVTRRPETSADRKAKKEQEKAEEAARKDAERAQKEKEKAEEATRREEERLQKVREKEEQAREKERIRQERLEKWKKYPIKQIVIAVIVLAILVAVAVYVLTRKETVSVQLGDYVSVTFEGYDSYGTAAMSFDYDALEEDLAGAEWKEEELEGYLVESESETTVDVFMETYAPYDLLYSILETAVYELNQTEALSNGDSLTLSWVIDEDLLAELESIAYCDISFDDVSYIVENLTEIDLYDPFDAVMVSVSGKDGEGVAELTVSAADEMTELISYSLSAEEGLSNGDIITVSVTNDPAEFEELYGVQLSATSKKYEVAGLYSYISSTEEIPEETLEKMRTELEDHFNAYAASTWSLDEFSVLGFDYIGYYFLTEKYSSSPHNMIYLVYQVNVEYYAETETGEIINDLLTYYYYGGYEDLILEGDGSISLDYLSLLTPGEEIEYYGETFYGYQSLTVLYSDVVTTKIGDYSYENHVADQDFSYTVTHFPDEEDSVQDETETKDSALFDETDLTEEDSTVGENNESASGDETEEESDPDVASEETGESAIEEESSETLTEGETEETETVEESDSLLYQINSLGIIGTTVSSAEAVIFDMPEGVYVTILIENGAAVGYDVQKRDIITAINDEAISTIDDLSLLLEGFMGGDEIILTIQRLDDSGEYEELTVNMLLGEDMTLGVYEAG